MNKQQYMQSSLQDLKEGFKEYLQSLGYKPNSIQTSSSMGFYLINKYGKESFWFMIESDHFEFEAKELIEESLDEHLSSKECQQKINYYMLHIRKLRNYLLDNDITRKQQDIPTPCKEQVLYYLDKWQHLENYTLQEDALNKLFFELCPNNKDISDILLKASTLNDFYSTNIYNIYAVAKNILSLDIDERLNKGDLTLVNDIQNVTLGDKEKHFYSFATKYCSHHRPNIYPINDSFVEKVLKYFKKQDHFYEFNSNDLKDYLKFNKILKEFIKFYNLEEFTMKQIDCYIWQLGKQYFPKKY